MRHSPYLLLIAALGTAATAVADDAAERARIGRERAEVEQRYVAAERECQSRFAVTACLDTARVQRRDALNRLRGQELVLDQAERRQRAAERAAAIRAKQAARDAAAPAAIAPATAASLPPARLKLRERQGGASAAREGHRVSPEEESRRRQAYAERQRDAERHRAEVERRRAERAAKGKPRAAALPLPEASAPSAPAR